MKITSNSLLNKNEKFDLNRFKEPFCSNELDRFKRYETIKEFKFPKFWQKSNSFNQLGKVLFISGPARNGNHLTLSMLDGHKEILSQPGEDFMLREFMSLAKENEEEVINKLRSENNIDFILNLSGATFDKWYELWNLEKNNLKSSLWSGQQPENESHITDYQDLIPKINYPKFKEFLFQNSKIISNCETFLDFFAIYLKSLQYLADSENKKLLYPYLWAYSGLRRELFYLLSQASNIITICPIRKFESFYFSYAKSRYKTSEVKQEILNELWEHWRHKTIDYLLLQNQYPDKIIFIKFEDLINDTKNLSKKLSKKLNIKFQESMLTPTTMGVPNKGNSSFAKDDSNFGKIYKSSAIKKFSKDIILPDEYYDILESVHKLAL